MNPNVYINALPMATAVGQFERVLSLRVYDTLAHARFGVEEAVECVGGVVGEGVLDLLDELGKVERPQLRQLRVDRVEEAQVAGVRAARINSGSLQGFVHPETRYDPEARMYRAYAT